MFLVCCKVCTPYLFVLISMYNKFVRYIHSTKQWINFSSEMSNRLVHLSGRRNHVHRYEFQVRLRTRLWWRKWRRYYVCFVQSKLTGRMSKRSRYKKNYVKGKGKVMLVLYKEFRPLCVSIKFVSRILYIHFIQISNIAKHTIILITDFISPKHCLWWNATQILVKA